MSRIAIILVLILPFRACVVKDDTKPYRVEINQLQDIIKRANDRILEANKVLNSKNKIYAADSAVLYY